MEDHIRELETWYESQCDGDWEHGYGVEIGSLDNPGWQVKINLEGTPLEDQVFSEVSNLEPERDWIRCWVADKTFEGVGGPRKLREILQVFLQWARDHSRRSV